MVFDTTLELKKFCLAVYHLTKNETIKEHCSLMGWQEEIDHLHDQQHQHQQSEALHGNYLHSNNDVSRKTHKAISHHTPMASVTGTEVPNDFNRLSFLAMNMRSSRSTPSADDTRRQSRSRSRRRSRSRSRSNSPHREGVRSVDRDRDRDSAGGRGRGRDAPPLRREESFSSTLDKLLGDRGSSDEQGPADGRAWATPATSLEHLHDNKLFGHLVFSEPCLLLQAPPSASVSAAKSKSKSASFTRHVFQIYHEGHLIFTETKGQIASSQCAKPAPHLCHKLLCFKVDANMLKKNMLKASNFLGNVNDTEVGEVILGIELHETVEGATPRGRRGSAGGGGGSAVTTVYM